MLYDLRLYSLDKEFWLDKNFFFFSFSYSVFYRFWPPQFLIKINNNLSYCSLDVICHLSLTTFKIFLWIFGFWNFALCPSVAFFIFILLGICWASYIYIPDSSVGKESACNAGDPRSIPGLGRSTGEGIGYPLQYSCLENSMDCIVHGVTKSGPRVSNFHFISVTYVFHQISASFSHYFFKYFFLPHSLSLSHSPSKILTPCGLDLLILSHRSLSLTSCSSSVFFLLDL